MSRLDQLRAEALAWPLADPAAFEAGLVRHDEPVLLPGFRVRAAALGLHPTADDMAREVWGRSSDPLRCLALHAADLLEPWNRHLRLVPDRGTPSREILRWRWTTLSLPQGLLIAAATPENQRPTPSVSLLPPALLSGDPVAHIHLHLGAVYPFEVLWSHLATTFTLDAMLYDTARPAPFRGTDWARWLARAYLARRHLASEILGVRRPAARPLVLEIADESRTLGELRRGRLTGPGADRLDLRDRAIARLAVQRRHASARPRRLAEVWARDPIADGGPWPEGRLLQVALQQELPEQLARLLVQYIRIKVALYRHLVADATCPGLSTFVQTYSRISAYEADLKAVAMDLAADDPAIPLRAVEARVQPPRLVSGLLDHVAPRTPDLSSRDAPSSSLEWGYVLHFIRAKGTLMEGARREVAPNPGLRLYERLRDHLARAGSLVRALDAWPQLLTVVRGLDLAGDEREGPLWLAIPALRRALRASRAAAGRLAHLEPLRMTLHAGEDFRHLLSGVRATMEPFEWRLLRPGDRLGHAMALGVDAERWFQRNSEVLIRRWDRLQDLVWAVGAVAQWGLHVQAATLRRWEEEIGELAETIWGAELAPRDLQRLRETLGEPDFLPGLSWFRSAARANPQPLSAGRPPTPADLMDHLLGDPACGRRAFGTISVDAEPDLDATRLLQERVRRHVAQSMICVELNPSSNLVIGGLDSPLDQPMFQLRPLHPRQDEAVVPVSLNADDPLCFSTALSDEYAYTWGGLVAEARLAPAYVTGWFDEAVRTSWRFRFTSPESARPPWRPPGAPGRIWWSPPG